MNTIVTSKEAILSASKAIAQENGLASINMREVAARCGVAVGSVYNYFPSKAELMAATVAAIWKSVFHAAQACTRPEGFAHCVEWMFQSVHRGLEAYPSFFSLHAMGFAAGEKQAGREAMEQYFLHAKEGLLRALTEDPEVREDAFNAGFTAPAFVDFVFSNVLSMLMQGRDSCDLLIEVIRRGIYRQSPDAAK